LKPKKKKKTEDAFKLAAYGVKQGGIGSILAGGFSLKRSSTRNSMSAERPTSTNSTSSHSEVSVSIIDIFKVLLPSY
jgi:hypothetical protein